MEIDPNDRTWDDLMDAVVRESLTAESIDPLDVHPETLPVDAAVGYLAALQRVQSRLAALESRALIAAVGPYIGMTEVPVHDAGSDRDRIVTITDGIRDELAAMLRRSPGAMHDDIVVARLIIGPLAGTGAALAAGRITARHARVIANQARRFDGYQVAVFQHPDVDSPADARLRLGFTNACHALESRVLPAAEATTPQRTEALARRAVAAIDTEAEERRRRQARALIDVHLVPDEDGLALLLARLPIEQAIRLHASIDQRARHAAADCSATLGELRVQALVDAVCTEGTTCVVGTVDTTPRAAPVVEVQVVIDAAALVGLLDTPATVTSGPLTGTPMTAQAVRDLVDDPDVPTTLRRLVTDPITGHLLDRGRRSYTVSDAMRAFLFARDRTCRFPGCTRPARGCQVDHALAWDDGGATDVANTGLLCIRHHQLKTHADWQITDSKADGTCTWRSPLGQVYVVGPEPVLIAHAPPDRTADPEPDPPAF